MQKITPWILHDDCSLRHVVGEDVDDVRYRVALIEKSPRVRIRAAHLGERNGRYEDGEPYTERQWPEHLDWCYGDKGDGPDDEDSKLWCDNMLRALGYQL
jgi:hypothetical protein